MSLSFLTKDRYVGLDIGHSTLAFAQVEQSGSSYRVLSHGILPTPENAIAEGVVTDPDALAYAIRDGLREFHISATTANLAVAGSSVIVRNVLMPTMPEAALRKSIKFEAGRYVPGSVDESFVECEILSDHQDGEMEVLLATCPRDMVETKVAAANAAGLDVEVVDIEAFALYRTLVETDSASEASGQTIGLIDVGGDSTHVSVVDHGSFALTRSIPIGGKSMTAALQNYFKMNFDDAENGKRSLNLLALINSDGPMENPPLRVVQPLVDELVREVRRSLNYFQSQQSEKGQQSPISRLLVSGGGSLLNGLPEHFGHKLNLPVSAPNPFDNPRFLYDGFEPPADSRSLAVAMGLALRRAGREAIAA